MKESTLLKCALIFSLIGLIALHFIAQSIEIKGYRPMLDKDIGEDVRLTGIVRKISSTDSVNFISLAQESQMTVVFFSGKDSGLKEKDKIEVFGKVQSYNGKKEIIAERISVVR